MIIYQKWSHSHESLILVRVFKTKSRDLIFSWTCAFHNWSCPSQLTFFCYAHDICRNLSCLPRKCHSREYQINVSEDFGYFMNRIFTCLLFSAFSCLYHSMCPTFLCFRWITNSCVSVIHDLCEVQIHVWVWNLIYVKCTFMYFEIFCFTWISNSCVCRFW